MEAGLHPNTTHCSWVRPSRACVRRQDCDWYLTTVTRCKRLSHLPFVNYQCCFPSCCCELSDLEKNPGKFLFFGASPWETSQPIWAVCLYSPVGSVQRHSGPLCVIVWVINAELAALKESRWVNVLKELCSFLLNEGFFSPFLAVDSHKWICIMQLPQIHFKFSCRREAMSGWKEPFCTRWMTPTTKRHACFVCGTMVDTPWQRPETVLRLASVLWSSKYESPSCLWTWTQVRLERRRPLSQELERDGGQRVTPAGSWMFFLGAAVDEEARWGERRARNGAWRSPSEYKRLTREGPGRGGAKTRRGESQAILLFHGTWTQAESMITHGETKTFVPRYLCEFLL